MSRVKGKNTTPERVVRGILHRLGFRFRLHRRSLPGKPDIVLAKRRTVIFVHGCFWHGHSGCSRASRPSSNVAFWNAKLDLNHRRDEKVRRELRTLGWRVVVVWECQTRDEESLRGRLQALGSRSVQRMRHRSA